MYIAVQTVNTALYIHWPFCESKCPYCDFNSHVREKIEHTDWQKAYLKELEYYADKGRKISSIFFGGGTPSLMNPKTVEAIIQKAHDVFDVESGIEITLEANPSSFEVEKFREFKAAGINRVSIGVQSFDENALKFLGRRHDAKQAITAIEQAGNIFGNFSFDLIYALPDQTEKSWLEQLNYALGFGSPHISLYQLTIEKGTPFYSDFHKGKFVLPEEEVQTELYVMTVEECAKRGLMRYEVSNFAKAGHESRHNLSYWKQNDYIGIGPGAHGRLRDAKGKVATMNIHSPENWLTAVAEKGHGLQSSTELAEREILEELVFMGLRIREGLELDKFSVLGSQFSDLVDAGLLKKLCEEGLMEVTASHVRLTDKGMLLHTGIVKRLLA